MGIQTELNRIETAKEDIKTAINNKGVSVPSGIKIDGLAALINSISSGGGGNSGGLPNGVTALDFGTFTIEADSSSDYPVYHNLGQAPNFFLFYTNDMYTMTDMAGYCFFQAAIPRRIQPNGAFYTIGFVSTNQMMQATMNMTSEVSTVFASNLFVVDAASARKIKGGITYNWICGVIDMD